MTSTYILAIDQGTTGTTALVIDVREPIQPEIIGRDTQAFAQRYPKPGWVEHDLNQIWYSVERAVANACAHAQRRHSSFQTSQIAAIGLSNQRETLCTFERATGEPVLPAIVWQDKRSEDICQRLKSEEATLRARTGLLFDPYFSGTKMAWILENHPDLRQKVISGQVLFGTIDTFLIYRLTGGRRYLSEPSNASRTMIFNAITGQYDSDLAAMLGLPHLDCLPVIQDSAGDFGETQDLSFLPNGIPITGVLGDQQAALAGQTCFEVGEAKCTYGTGAFLLLQTGDQFKLSQNGLLSTVAWRLNGQLSYALEGSSFIAGAAVQFLRDQMQWLPDANASSEVSSLDPAAPHIYFVPALAGLGAPYWDPKARGAFLGLTRGTTKAEMVRAVLEGIAFAVDDLYEAMLQDFAWKDQRLLRVDGGASINPILMQFQADLSEAEVDRPEILETTAFGAALFAGLGAGLYHSVADLRHMRRSDRTFQPHRLPHTGINRREWKSGWRRAIQAVQVFHGGSELSR